MRKPLAALLVMVLAGSFVRGDDKDTPLEGDLKKIQGKWTTNAGPSATALTLNFDKHELKITVLPPAGEEVTITGEFSIDEKESPKKMDWVNMKNGKGELPKRLAIYEFDGEDKLKIAGGPDEKTRPKEMVEKTANSGNTLVFTRVKADKK